MDTNKRTLITSLVLALLCVGLLYKYSQDVKAELGYGATVRVLVAKSDIPANKPISGAAITTLEIPKVFVHPAAFGEGDSAMVEGRTPLRGIRAGQLILLSDLKGGTTQIDKLSSLVEPGRRALTIPVDPRLALGGLVEPGDRVDVILTFTTVDQGRATQTILQNVPVGAVGTRYSDVLAEDNRSGPKKANDVTLLVTPEDSEYLVYALQRGEIALALRASGDAQVVSMERRNFALLLGEAPPVVAVPRTSAPVIEPEQIIEILQRRSN